MTQPGWYADPNDPNAEIYWSGYQWSGRRPRTSYPGHPMYAPGFGPPVPPRKTMGVGKVLAITAACVLSVVIAFVVYAVATGPKTEFERCVQTMRDGILEYSQERAEEYCRTMEDMKDLPTLPK